MFDINNYDQISVISAFDNTTVRRTMRKSKEIDRHLVHVEIFHDDPAVILPDS